MKIHGLQKMTLLDYPGLVACTVFLGGCDFRCQFCHNYELVDGSAEPVMEEEEFYSFLSKRVGVLDGVCVTGGEPCLRPELPEFIRRIKDMGFKVKLDTNGGHPDMVKELLDAGLIDYVAMDIKNSPDKYAMTIGCEFFNLNPINRTVSLLLENRIDYEFRTTVVEQYHAETDFHEIGKWISGAKNYFLQQYVPRDTVPDCTLEAPSRETMENYVNIAREYVPTAKIRGVE
ncbi:anaerobic ribonucleoside-triphosphate reductase activating protein [Butyrivibrio sp. VCB2006]|uniref:anaerobic ribonucleoside-triphosphate reductase activating protein n=1 Tax=Butyrivibrio sp. VCB2006 TaxID=1280679 RepID=UPI0004066BB7|nr:anaerobic ribonucleoside-triphosphate reductase activating protein [Butyrivibrio sp. VCB2006]